MFEFLRNNPLVEEARTARFRPRSLAVHFLIFFLVMTIAETAAGVPVTIYASLRLFMLLGSDFFLSEEMLPPEELAEKMNAGLVTVMGEDGYLLVTLFAMAIVSLLVLIYCRFIERRPLSSMGLSRLDASAFLQYVVGLLLGLLLFLCTFGILLLTGAVTIVSASPSALMLLLFFFGFLIQGAAEEILVRGYFMVSMTSATTSGRAIVWSALFFALLHIGNVGLSFLAVLNLFLFGILLGLIVFRTGKLYMAAALHGVWNFAEGNIAGLPVSGLRPQASIFTATPDEGHSLISGGAFGPEGGAVVTVVLLIALVIFVLYTTRAKKEEL